MNHRNGRSTDWSVRHRGYTCGRPPIRITITRLSVRARGNRMAVAADRLGPRRPSLLLTRLLCLLNAAVIFLAGCTAGEVVARPTDAVMSAEQAAALTDGAIDYDEYHEGFRRFVACLSARGYEVLIEEESFDLVNFGVPEAAVDAGDDLECYHAEFQAIDIQWQGDHIETSETAWIMTRCLEDHGLDAPATIAEKDALLRANDIPLEDCL